VTYRILMLLENLSYPEDVRVRKEARSLVTSGFEVTLVAPSLKGQPAVERSQGVRIYRFPAAFAKDSRASSFFVEYAWASLWLTLFAYWVWLRHGLDAIHLHNPPDSLFAIALPFRLLGKAIVYDNHDLVPELIEVKFRSRLLTTASEVLEGLSCRWADTVIVANDFARDLLVQRHGLESEKVSVVRNGPSQVELDALGLFGANCSDFDVRFGFIGAIDPQDGVESIIEALYLLRQMEPDLRFACRIIGNGLALRDVRERTLELGLAEEIEFCDFLPWPKAMRALAECDICIDAAPLNPYHRVNEAVKVLEYMAHGKPMVLTDSPGHRAAAGDAALYVESEDYKGFAERLLELTHDRELARRLGANGRDRFEREFSWEIMECRLTSVYTRLQGR